MFLLWIQAIVVVKKRLWYTMHRKSDDSSFEITSQKFMPIHHENMPI